MNNLRRSVSGAREQPVEHVDSTCLTLAEQFDAKINAHYAEIRKLCASRNSQCSAARKLPAEALSMVFRELSSGDERQRRSPSWVYVTHVCRAWRTAALSEPMLWNNTIGLSKRWLKLCLRRAAAVPLKVVYPRVKNACTSLFYDLSSSDSSLSSSSSSPSSSPDRDQRINKILEEILDTPERLGELELGNGSAHVIDRMSKPAPFLSTLRLCGNLSIPLTFLGNSAPRLRVFTLLDCAFPTEVTWLRNLRTLILSRRWGFKDNDGNDAPITTASFLSIISPLEKLEALTVHFSSNPIVRTAHQDYMGGVTRFPFLRTTDFRFLDESSTHLANLFTHVQFPSIHSLHVVWPHYLGLEDANRLFTSFVSRCCLPFRRLVWDDLITLHVDLPSGGPTFTFDYLCTPSFEELPLQGVDTIEQLDIRDYEALLYLFSSPTTGSVPYPSLKQLSFDSSLLRPSRVSRPEECQSNCVMLSLTCWLQERTAPYNLERLVISGSKHVTEQDIESLEKLVPVTWIRDE